MSTEYLSFAETGDTGKTKTWDVVSLSSGSRLGRVKWYGPWRQYVFYPDRDTLWNHACMATVKEFLVAQNRARRDDAAR